MKRLDPWEMPLGGTALIEASAGTGKTYTLETLYLRLLVEVDLTPSQILVVTYTQAATAELRERVRGRVQQAIQAGERDERGEPVREGDGEEDALRAIARLAAKQASMSGRPNALLRAIREFDEAAIFTIHGFCQRTLQENAFESGLAFDTELVEKSGPIEETLAHDLFRRLLAGEHPSFVTWLLSGDGKRWDFEPGELAHGLLEKLGADEDTPIVPPMPEFEVDGQQQLGRIVDEAAGALRAWRDAWVADREAIHSLLTTKSGQDGSKYRIDRIKATWIPDLEDLARRIDERDDVDALAALPLTKHFEKLTREALAKGTKKDCDPIEHDVFEHFDHVWRLRTELDDYCEARALWLRHRFVELARAESERRRAEKHILFFDDLLSELRRALRSSEAERLAALLRERYRFALIDEFQDTDRVQYEIFRKVWHEGECEHRRGLVLVGDPKQAIYSFRGADVFTYLEAREDAGEETYGLEVNWRSDPGLISAVNAIFEGRERAFRLDPISFSGVEPRPGFEPKFDPSDRPASGLRVLLAEGEAVSEALGLPSDEKQTIPVRIGRTLVMDAVAADIADLLSSGAMIDGKPIEASQIAILGRRKLELERARSALEAIGVPCVDRGDADVFDSREAWELACVLRAMMRAGDPAVVRAALSSGAHGMGAAGLARLDDDSPDLAEYAERFAEYGRIWSQSGFSRAFETWRRDEGVTSRLLAFADGERRLTNWHHLAELLQRVASDRSPSRAGLVAALERAIASEDARAIFGSDASLLRLERDDQAVSLVTLHRSKGLEYPIVYLPSVWEEIRSRLPSESSVTAGTGKRPPLEFHDASSNRRTLDLAGHEGYKANLACSVDEAFSEQLRLLYVGLTRAKHQCVVVWGKLGKAAHKAPLAWLLHGAEGDRLDSKKAASALAAFGDADWRAAWENVADRAEAGAVSIEPIESKEFTRRERWQPPDEPVPEIAYRSPSRRLSAPRRTTSFSGLTREGHRLGVVTSGPEVVGRDLDAEVVLTPAEKPAPRLVSEEEPPDLAADMHAFPRGAEAGTLLHEVLERVDYWRYDEARIDEAGRAAHERDVRDLALDVLSRNHLEEAHVDQVLHVVESVARTDLDPAPASGRLAAIAPGQFLPEMEFTLVTPGGEGASALDPRSLAALLEQAPEKSPLARYADRAGRMGFRPLSGFLRGFIDAVFFDGERYFLIDYKSNHLGNHQADYMPESLVEPMISHDYVLQYLFYVVALDRHLATRLDGYDYDTHFGGAYYLFLRGLAPSHAPGCGVFFDRPPKEIVHGVSRLMGGPLGVGR